MKDYKALVFETEIKPQGNSGHIIVPRGLVGKQVHVQLTVQEPQREGKRQKNEKGLVFEADPVPSTAVPCVKEADQQ